jgi:hypothetical protein
LSRSLWFVAAGVILIGAAALVAVFVATKPFSGTTVASAPPVPMDPPAEAPQVSLSPPQAFLPSPQAFLPSPQAFLPSPQAPPALPPPVRPEGFSAAVWEDSTDRLDALAEMQRHSLERGIQGLNERAARRAAMAGAATASARDRASQAPAR